MNLRWYSQSRRVTSAQIVKYAEQHMVSWLEAKRLMAQQSGLTLQYQDGNGDWHDVPHEHRYLS